MGNCLVELATGGSTLPLLPPHPTPAARSDPTRADHRQVNKKKEKRNRLELSDRELKQACSLVLPLRSIVLG